MPVYPWASNQLFLHDEVRAVPLELHWAVTKPHQPGPMTGEVLSRVVEASPVGLMLEPEDLLLALAAHSQQHHGALKTLFDLAAWLDCYASEVSWSRVCGYVPVVMGVLGSLLGL